MTKERDSLWEDLENYLRNARSSDQGENEFAVKFPSAFRSCVESLKQRSGAENEALMLGSAMAWFDFGLHLAEDGSSLIIKDPDGQEKEEISNSDLRRGLYPQ